ncbi:hypothetical protein Taro_053062 [Colocasia esculenta]|uniref:Uncharacterized protein n=1 Tax=Colocasia esculenta TaxID=4460 RepID=A0A843XJX1_COLES|nr:hypothetical protein [Colocasia esculenta]
MDRDGSARRVQIVMVDAVTTRPLNAAYQAVAFTGPAPESDRGLLQHMTPEEDEAGPFNEAP